MLRFAHSTEFSHPDPLAQGEPSASWPCIRTLNLRIAR